MLHVGPALLSLSQFLYLNWKHRNGINYPPICGSYQIIISHSGRILTGVLWGNAEILFKAGRNEVIYRWNTIEIFHFCQKNKSRKWIQAEPEPVLSSLVGGQISTHGGEYLVLTASREAAVCLLKYSLLQLAFNLLNAWFILKAIVHLRLVFEFQVYDFRLDGLNTFIFPGDTSLLQCYHLVI